jgi:NAD(P)-dependent dehydrogenase (short-subunit alcohol dehydrogenase family)
MTQSRIVLVTGGSRGIGRSIALRAADAGYDVVLTYRSNEREARAAVDEITALGRRAKALPLDSADSRSFAGFAAQLRATLAALDHPRLDALVLNAGTSSYAVVGDITAEALQEQFDVHVKGPLLLTQALLPLVADGGRVVAITSGLARYTYPGSAAYGAMKAALDALVRYLARELGPRNITVNAVAPGGIVTDIGGGVMRDPQVQQAVVAQTPLGRLGMPDDIGGLVALLLAPGAGWITGQRIEATGGYAL